VPDPGFNAYLVDALQPLGHVRVRRMFSGEGVFIDGLMMAIIMDGVLYLKADTLSVDAFVARGLEPFHYQRRGRQYALSYWCAPSDLYDDEEALLDWGRAALEAAQRAQS